MRCASCGADVRNRLLAACRIAADDDDMDAKLSQFMGCLPANTARSSCNECCQRIGSHWPFPLISCCFILFQMPNAGAHLLPEAGARHERRLEAVRGSALFGAVWSGLSNRFDTIDGE